MSIPAGWHPDPEHPGQLRYWDGTAWTDHRAPAVGESPKSNTVKILLGVLIGVFVLCGGGCFALLAGAGGDDPAEPVAGNDSAASSVPTKAAPGDDPGNGNDPDPFGERGDQDHPVAVAPGKAFDIRGFEYQAGWRISSGFVGLELDGLKVKNMRDRKDSALIDFKFWRGQEVLATVSCTSDPIAPGTTVTLNCFSTDEAPGTYERLTVQDTF